MPMQSMVPKLLHVFVKLQGVLCWSMVQDAIQQGCTSPKAILEHISQTYAIANSVPGNALSTSNATAKATTTPAPSQSEQSSEDVAASRTTIDSLSSHKVNQCHESKAYTPLVTIEHLRKQLGHWCESGQLRREARGKYALADDCK